VNPLNIDVSAVTTALVPTLSGAGEPVASPYVLLHTSPYLSLASDQLLLAPDQAPAFANALALAEALAQLRDEEAGRVQAAVAAGHAQGLAEGLAEGRAEALQKAARDTADTTQRLARQAAEEAGQLQEHVVALALLVVRRIAADLAPDVVLAALARQAFEHLASTRGPATGEGAGGLPWQACQLRLHPSQLQAVQVQLADAPGLHLVADDSLAPLDCVLDTPGGRLLAGLETQLARVQARLARAGRTDLAFTP
jgi:flagellar biosynthesis/type III secretory pathway protein FliH